LYMRALLAQQGIDIAPKYVGTHSNAYRQVLSGETAAAGGIRATLNREPQELRERLRVLYETPTVPAHPVAAHPRVPKQVSSAFVAAWLRFPATPQGQALLDAVLMPNPVRADFGQDYAPLQRLRLERFAVDGGD
jgi:phosphonate transport system substrate-binding protein